MADSVSEAVPVSSNEPQMSSPAAYERLLPEIRAVSEELLVHINLDVLVVVTTLLGALPELRALRPRIVAELPQFDLERFDKLELMARALSHAHAQFVAATKPLEALPAVVEEATKLREVLYPDALALSNRGLLDGSKFKDVKRTTGHRALALDLQVLSLTMKEQWSRIAAKTAVSPEELERAVELADRLQLAVGLREQGPTGVEQTTSIRSRAFSLFVRNYDEARRAVSYLRWHEGDVDTIAPSLYAARQPTGRKRKGEEETRPDSPNGSDLTPSAPLTPAVEAAPVGLPGSSPFASA
jgi:hypothetical protein